MHDKGGRTIILFDFAGSVVATPAASFMLPRILQPWFPRVVPQLSNAKDLNLTTSVNLHWYSQVIQGAGAIHPRRAYALDTLSLFPVPNGFKW